VADPGDEGVEGAAPPADDSCVRAPAVTEEQFEERFEERFEEQLRVRRGPVLVTAGLAVLFAAVHAVLAVRRHDAFGTWGFDLGIYDQATWLVARGRSFLSTRGLDVWGHHVNLIALAYAPLSWLGGGARMLVVTQAAVLALGAWPAHRLAAQRLGGTWAGPVGALSYLAMPAVGWLAWNNFHFEALAVTPLLFAWWWATQGRWRMALVATLVALSTREEVGLVVFVMGLALLWSVRRGPRPERRRAAAGAAVGLGWYLVCTKLVMPHALGGADPYYFARFYGDWGGSAGELVRNMARRPDDVVRTSLRSDRVTLWSQLLVPTGGLALLGAPVLLAAAPQALAVALGSQWFLRDVRFQYTALMLAPLVLATIEGAGRLVRRWPSARPVVLGWIACSAVVGHVWLAPSPLGSGADQWAGVADTAPYRAALTVVGPDDGVSAIDNVVPHVAQRDAAFSYPNPFLPVVYGVSSRDLAPASLVAEVRWIVWHEEPSPSGGRGIDAELFEALTNDLRAYQVVERPGDGVVVARQVRPLTAEELAALRARFADRPSS
jgi:uncharacterized membrane protein